MQYSEPGERRRLQGCPLWRLVPLQRSTSGTWPRLLFAIFYPFLFVTFHRSQRPSTGGLPGNLMCGQGLLATLARLFPAQPAPARHVVDARLPASADIGTEGAVLRVTVPVISLAAAAACR